MAIVLVEDGLGQRPIAVARKDLHLRARPWKTGLRSPDPSPIAEGSKKRRRPNWMGGEKRAECNSGMTGWQWLWRAGLLDHKFI